MGRARLRVPGARARPHETPSSTRLQTVSAPSTRAPTNRPSDEVVLTGHDLSREVLLAVAGGGCTVRAAEAALDEVARVHRAAGRVPMAYGRTTGVGALATEGVSEAHRRTLPLRLLRSHASGIGGVLPEEVVRVALVVRANQLLDAGSGISPAVVAALLRAANHPAVPVVHELGGLGTADLTALAEIGLALLGEAPWSGAAPEPLSTLEPGDGLALLSSNAVTLARAALGLDRLATVLGSADAVASLSATALRANPEAFDPRALDRRALDRRALDRRTLDRRTAGARERSAARIRELLAQGLRQPSRIQDPYPLRCIPQVHGAAQEALEDTWIHVELECNGAAENPLFVSTRPSGRGAMQEPSANAPGEAAGEPVSPRDAGADDDGRVEALHHGGFLALSATLSLDRLRAALLPVALASTGRLGLLVDPSRTGLRPFLADGEEGSSGVMLAEYVAQAALARLRWASTPASGWPVSISLGIETLASWLPLSVEQLELASTSLAQVLAAELLAAARANRQSGHPLGPDLARLLSVEHTASGSRDEDAPLGAAIEALALAIGRGL